MIDGVQNMTKAKSIRFLKTIYILSLACYFLLVAYNNFFSYQTNFKYVVDTLSMSGLLNVDSSIVTSRKLTDPIWHHLIYYIFILTELSVGLLGLFVTVKLFYHLNSDTLTFNRQKEWVSIFLLTPLIFFHFAFFVLAGEWWLIWCSPLTGGGINSASRVLISLIAGIIIFMIPEPSCERDSSFSKNKIE